LVGTNLPTITTGDRLVLFTGPTWLGGGYIDLYANGSPYWGGGASLTVPYADPAVAGVFAK